MRGAEHEGGIRERLKRLKGLTGGTSSRKYNGIFHGIRGDIQMKKMLLNVRTGRENGVNIMKLTPSTVFLGLFLVLFTFTGGVFADSAKPPCGTSGPLGITNPSPSSYSYDRTESGSVNGNFTVSSPSLNINPSCNSSLPYVYGNGDPGTAIDIIVRITDITDSVTGEPVDYATAQAIKASVSFTPAYFTLYSPGTGNQVVDFTFTNNNLVPSGSYDINIQTKPAKEADGTEANEGVGTANTSFTIAVTDPVTCDTEAPTVNITSPTSNAKILINGLFPVDFTAVDPTQSGVGTGIKSVSANIQSCAGTANYAVFPLAVDPPLSVMAGVQVAATADFTALQIGNYTLIANAVDNASGTCAVEDNTGSAQVNFSVGANIAALPPITVSGKTFKSGSNVPVKWALTDANGAFLPPYLSATISISDGVNTVYSTGISDNTHCDAKICYTVDGNGNAAQYSTNYTVPSAGTYTVTVYVNGVCGDPFALGSFTFTATSK